jgi:serine/threonine protein kinase/Flp pilus assembly protein TadD
MPNLCPNCGTPRSESAQAGLCPRCLMLNALPSDANITYSFLPSDPAQVLETLTRSVGPMPRVLLPDTAGGTEESPLVKPSSTEMPAPADRSSRVQLLGEIARGGMGAVLKGRDADLGRDLAVKVLLDTHRGNPDLIRRFVEEAQIGGQLQHPGIVPVYELGTFGDSRPYFTMKLVKGRTLADLLGSRKDAAEDVPKFLGIFEQIAQTVAYAHARGVIHRDLKPSNVMVGSFGEVQVMDWGLAKVLPKGGASDDASAGKVEVHETVIATARSGTDDSDLSRAGSVMGTPSYMAPEQARGEIHKVDERADVFALGSILSEILTGQPAFTGRNSGEIQRKAARADLLDATARLQSCQADPALVALTLTCLAAESEDRPRHAGEVAERVDAYRTGVQERLRNSELERARAEARAVEEQKRTRLVVALAAAIIGMIGLGGGGAVWFEQLRVQRLSNLRAVVARVETLGEKALIEGPNSTSRREALAVADQSLGSMDDLADSEPGLRLKAVRNRLVKDEEAAALDETFLKELTRERAALAKNYDGSYNSGAIDSNFTQVFRRYKLDIETVPVEEAIQRVKSHPTTFVQSVLSAVDHWLIFRSELKNDPNASGKAPDLRKLLDLASGLDPDRRRNALRGLLEQGDLPQHRPELIALSQEKPIFEAGPATPLLLARSLVLAGDSPTAISVLKKSVLLYPVDLWSNHQLAELLGKAEPPQWDEAIRYHTAVRSIQPEVGWSLIPALLNRNRDNEAEQLLDELTRVDPENFDLLVSLAMEVNPAGGIAPIGKRMIAHLRNKLAKHPDDPTIHRKIAVIALCFRVSLDLAIAEFREASRLDPTDDFRRRDLGYALRRKGDLQGAIVAFQDAIRLSPDYSYHHAYLARLLKENRDLPGEVAELREAMRCEAIPRKEVEEHSRPSLDYSFGASGSLESYVSGYFSGFSQPVGEDNPEVAIRLAEALVRSGDFPGALAVCEAAMISGKSFPQSRSSRQITLVGNLFSGAGKWTEAIAFYRKAIELEPEKADEAHYGLSLSLAEAADLPAASRSLQQAIKQDKNALARPFRLLRAVSLAKDPEGAIETLRKIGAQSRDDLEVNQAIDQAIRQFQDFSRSRTPLPRIFPDASGISFPRLCYDRAYFTTAAIAWTSEIPPPGNERYNAACFAALAADGKGHDPLADPAAQASFRSQALGWLKAELGVQTIRLETAKPEDRSNILMTLKHWQKDTDLAGVRDPEPLAKLPEAERKEWQALWAEVDALIVKAEGLNANP